MKKDEAGFGPAILISLLFIVGIAIYAGYAIRTANSKTVASSAREEAFAKLQPLFDKFKRSSPAECPADKTGCIDRIIGKADRLEIARLYDITNSDNIQDIRVGMLKGSTVNNNAINAALNSGKVSSVSADTWYWEFDSCDLDRQIYVNAETGDVSDIRRYVNC